MKKAQKSPKTPRKNPQSTKPTNSFFARNKIALIVVTLILLFLLITIYIPNILLYNEWKPKMQTYLNNKYGTEFVIENVYHQSAEIGSPGTVFGQAHHPDHPDLTILLTGDKWDDFQQLYWQKQEQQRLTQVVHELFGNDTNVTVQLSFKTPTIEQSINYTYPLPDFETVRGELGDKVRVMIGIEQKELDKTPEVALNANIDSIYEFIKKEYNLSPNDVTVSHAISYSKDEYLYCGTSIKYANQPIQSLSQMKECYNKEKEYKR